MKNHRSDISYLNEFIQQKVKQNLLNQLCLLLFLPILFLSNGCGKITYAPEITTSNVGSITATGAVSGGTIVDDGGAEITRKGICWNTNPSPTIENNFTTNGGGSESFSSTLTGLLPGTTYYVRAYAENRVGISYGNELIFTTTAAGIVSNSGAGVTFNGYTYTSIVLGNGQEWMAENLRTTNYQNGDPIPNVSNASQWSSLTNGAWVYYNNDSQYENPYGKLYNWYAVADPRNICPTGWHVPSDAEWTLLTDYLGGLQVAGDKMKSTGTQYWQSPITDATNESGFSGLPGGYRFGSGPFSDVGYGGFWWSSTDGNATLAWLRNLSGFSGIARREYFDKVAGFSVRCLKD